VGGGAAPAPRPPVLAPAAAVAGAATIHEVLWPRAQAEPDRPHVYLRDADVRETPTTHGQRLSPTGMGGRPRSRRAPASRRRPRSRAGCASAACPPARRWASCSPPVWTS